MFADELVDGHVQSIPGDPVFLPVDGVEIAMLREIPLQSRGVGKGIDIHVLDLFPMLSVAFHPASVFHSHSPERYVYYTL